MFYIFIVGRHIIQLNVDKVYFMQGGGEEFVAYEPNVSEVEREPES